MLDHGLGLKHFQYECLLNHSSCSLPVWQVNDTAVDSGSVTIQNEGSSDSEVNPKPKTLNPTP